MWQRLGGWAAVGMVGLAGIGCVARVEPEIVPRPTPSVTPRPRFTPVARPSPVPTSEPTPQQAPAEEIEPVRFTVIYDNNVHRASSHQAELRTDWGFACWVEIGETVVLFDTGGDSAILLRNMAQLSLNPQAIDIIVLSHIHSDHVGGLLGLLDARIGASASSVEPPVVYVPATFPASFKADVRARTDLVEVTDPAEILPGVHTTGEVGSSIVEQALVVETGDGLAVVTGCAHPGIVEMVRKAKEAADGEVALVMGGFHLGGASQGQIEGIIADFRQLGVQRVAPCHCTGDRARQMLADAFGDDCILAGAGCVVTIDPEGTR